MKAVGIVVEYNPFHNGHLYHVKMARSMTDADVVIAVMSGYFLQRGEPAIVPKWERAKMALLNGVDLVVELPYVYSTQKAELFAKGAVTILAALGAEYINFGSESGNIDAFLALVEAIDRHRAEYERYVKEQIKKGVSYPRAAAEAFKRLDLANNVVRLDQPNNILGYHYVRAIKEGGFPMTATTTLRKQAHFHEETLPNASIASATSIRKAIMNEEEPSKLRRVMPEPSLHILNEYMKNYSLFHTWERYFPFLQYKVLSSSPEALRRIYECEEGLEYRVFETMKNASTFHEWMTLLKTKRYTWTRLQRLAVHILTNTTKEEMETALSVKPLPAVRLLGMTSRGQQYLRETRKDRTIEVLAKAKKATNPLAVIDERIARIYYLPLEASLRQKRMQEEFQRTPILPTVEKDDPV